MTEGTHDFTPCSGCQLRVRMPAGEVDRIVQAYLAAHPAEERADDETVAARLRVCAECPDLIYDTTCRHCGCLVAVRAHVSARGCPRPGGSRW